MRIGTLAATAFAAAVIVGLAGCTAASTVAEQTATATASPVVTPAVTPTPTTLPTITPLPPTKPTLDELLVSPDGVGPLVIGHRVKVEPAGLALVKFDANHCERPGEPGNAGWESTYSERSFNIATNPETQTGAIRTILVTSSHLTTYNAIHIGSTAAQLKAAYGTFDQVIHGQITDLFILRGSHGQLAFEVARQATFGTDKTPYWSKSDVNRVQFMSVWRLSDKPLAFSGTDGGPGSCA